MMDNFFHIVNNVMGASRKQKLEVAYSKAGYMPGLSFGSHMFQDLVEANILYIACMEKAETIHYNPEFLKDAMDIGENLLDDSIKGVLKVYDVSQSNLMLCMDALSREVICAKLKEENIQ